MKMAPDNFFSVQERKRRDRAVKLANIAIAVTLTCWMIFILVDHFRLSYDERWQRLVNTLLPAGLVTGLILAGTSLSIYRTRRAIWLMVGILLTAVLTLALYLLFKDFCVIC